MVLSQTSTTIVYWIYIFPSISKTTYYVRTSTGPDFVRVPVVASVYSAPLVSLSVSPTDAVVCEGLHLYLLQMVVLIYLNFQLMGL
jgi:hypothetical protein